MKPREIVHALLETDRALCSRLFLEASVHLPRRGTRWVASFRDETGRQVWRSTGTPSRAEARAMAREWEEQARRRRAALGDPPRKPTIRVRPGSAQRELGLLSQAEVAAILRISERAVREIERRAFDKLRHHPALRDFWREWSDNDFRENLSETALTRAEVASIYGLAHSPLEQRALQKLLTLAHEAV